MSDWHYVRDGIQQKPIDKEKLRQYLLGAKVDQRELAWKPGMSDWMPIHEIPELVEGLGLEPPEQLPPPLHTHKSQLPMELRYAMKDSPGTVASLFCGIASIIICLPLIGFILGIVAIAKYYKVERTIVASKGLYGGRGMAIAGLVTGIIGTLLNIPATIAFAIYSAGH